MYKVDIKDYLKVLNIITPAKHSIFPATVCRGHNKGWIYADNLENPKSALIYTNNLGGTLVGDYSNKEFNKKLKENLDSIIIPEVKKDNDEEFDLSGDSEAWDPIIKDLFNDKRFDIQPIKRFEYKRSNCSEKISTNDGFTFQKINLDLLNDATIKNIDKLIDEINVWYRDYFDFIENSFGFIALKDNELCGWSLSVCKDDHKVELAIETMEKFQKNGIATTLSSLFIDHCDKNDLNPEWECMDWNIASEKIALKLGFIHIYNYNLFSIEF